MTNSDKPLLQLLQRGVPLVREPFAQIAAELACDEQTVLTRIADLRKDGVIREISGIFDSAALGYRQTLATMRVAPALLASAGRRVSEHPGVSHCYAREGRYNLWFTLAVSPTSKLGLQKTAEALAKACGADAYLLLPTLKRYKLQVEFGPLDDVPSSPGGSAPGPAAAPQDPAAQVTEPRDLRTALTDAQVRAIRALQFDLPAQGDPFAPVAQAAKMNVDELLAHGAAFLSRGQMRRYAAVLHHRAAGAEANVLVAWNVPPPQADSAAARCAAFAAVSHCYLRPPAPDWPYNLYTMIHGRSRADCERTISEIVAASDLRDRAELWTTAEYKKQRVPLFGDEEKKWEHQTTT